MQAVAALAAGQGPGLGREASILCWGGFSWGKGMLGEPGKQGMALLRGSEPLPCPEWDERGLRLPQAGRAGMCPWLRAGTGGGTGSLRELAASRGGGGWLGGGPGRARVPPRRGPGPGPAPRSPPPGPLPSACGGEAGPARAAASAPPGGAAASPTYARSPPPPASPRAPAVAMVTAGCVAALTKLTQWAARHGRGRPLYGRRRC